MTECALFAHTGSCRVVQGGVSVPAARAVREIVALLDDEPSTTALSSASGGDVTRTREFSSADRDGWNLERRP